MWFAGPDCPNPSQCPNELYESGASQSFATTDTRYTFSFGHDSLAEGYLSTDQMTLVEQPAFSDIANDVHFVLAYQQNNFEDFSGDGVMGLAPYDAAADYSYKSFVKELADQGIIEKNMFSLYLCKAGLESTAWFGGYDPVHLEYNSANRTPDVQWEQMSSISYWSTSLRSVKVDGIDVSLSVQNAIFNTYQSMIQVPQADYDSLTSVISQNQDCDAEDGHYLCYCSGDGDTSFPTVELTLSDDVTLKLKSEWYLQYYSDYFEFKRCKVLFKPLDDAQSPFWLMGNPFLLSHTTVFDGSQNRVGFSENQYILSASIEQPEEIIDETPAYLPKNYTLAVVLVIIGVILLICLVVLVIWIAVKHVPL